MTNPLLTQLLNSAVHHHEHFSCSLGFSNCLFFCGPVDSLTASMSSCLSIYLSSSCSAWLLMVTFDGICSQRVIISALL